MTCIIGIKKNNQVLLASDSLTIYGNLKLVNSINDYKIYQFPYFSVALAGEGPVSEVLENIERDLSWNHEVANSRADCTHLLQSFGEKFTDKVPEAENDSLKYEFLIATKTKLFWCLSEPSVFEIGDYWAAGSGSDFALGVLYALHSQIGNGITIEEAAEVAVLAACKFNQDCEAPVDIRMM